MLTPIKDIIKGSVVKFFGENRHYPKIIYVENNIREHLLSEISQLDLLPFIGEKVSEDTMFIITGTTEVTVDKNGVMLLSVRQFKETLPIFLEFLHNSRNDLPSSLMILGDKLRKNKNEQ